MTSNLVLCALAPLLSVGLIAQPAPQVEAPAASGVAAIGPVPAQTQTYDHTLQDGTPVKLQLTRALSSADSKAGQEISFEVVDDIDVEGVTVLHRGSSAIGVVTEAEAKKRMGRAGKLNFTITSVQLADDEKVALRAVNDAKGDSRVKGMTALMVSGVPMVAAPFLLLMKGGDSSIPKGTQITAFIDGDMQLDMAKFGAPPQPAKRLTVAQTSSVQASLVIESTPAGADIEIDGAFVGNTPSTISATLGNHQISVKKKGFTDWSKILSVIGGTVHLSAVLEQPPAQ
jgi:hypothetical protein